MDILTHKQSLRNSFCKKIEEYKIYLDEGLKLQRT